jgi:DNA-binding NarL/FixJ family response regulator
MASTGPQLRLGHDEARCSRASPARTQAIQSTRQFSTATDTHILMLTTFDLDEQVPPALRAGASGFLLKATPPG